MPGRSNAASQLGGPVSPGELVTMYGQQLPVNPLVTFQGLSAVIVSADAEKIVAIVPSGISLDTTFLNIEGVGGYTLAVVPATPALFSADGSGTGQLDALNEDGTSNSTDNPAAAGSIVTVKMTGAGITGARVCATVNWEPARVVAVSDGDPGVTLVQLEIPAGVIAGDAVVKVNVRSGDSDKLPFQPRTTVSVR